MAIWVVNFLREGYKIRSTFGNMIFLKVSKFQKQIVKPWILPKNEPMNLFLLLCNLFLFVFLEETEDAKKPFEIYWPLPVNKSKYLTIIHYSCRQNNNHEQSAGMDLNCFIPKIIIKKYPWSSLGFSCYIARPIQPIFSQIGLDWLCYLTDKS